MSIRKWLDNIPQNIKDKVSKIEIDSFMNNSAKIYFSNNTLISIVWHHGAYCSSNKPMDALDSFVLLVSENESNNPIRDSDDAEIAWWFLGKDMQYFEESGDTVLGYQTPENIQEWCIKIMNKENVS